MEGDMFAITNRETSDPSAFIMHVVRQLNNWTWFGFSENVGKKMCNASPVRDRQRWLSKKRFSGDFSGYLSFWVSSVKSPLILLYKYIYIYIYIKKKLNIKYMTEIVHCH